VLRTILLDEELNKRSMFGLESIMTGVKLENMFYQNAIYFNKFV
jgi:hypothetical protein